MTVDSLKAMQAAQAEAADTPHVAKIRGEAFAFRRSQHWPAIALEMLENGQLHSGMRKLLADPHADGQRFDDLEPTVGEIEEAFNAMSGAEGHGPGESLASTASSNGTGPR